MTPRIADTGQGPSRRPLTIEEAQAGALPQPFTPREWKALRLAAHTYAAELFNSRRDLADGYRRNGYIAP